MLQQVVIKTNDRSVLKPLLTSAIQNEIGLIQVGLEKTQCRLQEFENRFRLTSTEFERRLNSNQIDETIETTEWRMEIGMLNLLQSQLAALRDAQIEGEV